MAVEFGILGNVPSAGARFLEGQQAAQAEADRNMLRQMQMEQMVAQRENIMAQREQRVADVQARQAAQAQAARRQEFLSGLGSKMAEGGYKLDRPTLASMLEFGLQSREESLIKLATEGLRALDEEDVYRSESTRLGLPGAAAPAAPTAPAAPMAAAPAAAPNAMMAGVTREQVQNMLMSPNARIRQQGQALASTLEKPQTYTPSADMQGYELAKSEGFKGTFFDYKRQLAEAGRAPSLPREPSKTVAVVGPEGKPIFVSAEEAIRERMTPAKEMEGLTPKEKQAREAKYPQATSAVKTFESTTDTLIKDLRTLRDHPGLSSITGIAAGRIPGITQSGREAEAIYDKVVARGGFQELQNMRNASPTGGALGNVSNQEGSQLRQAFAAIDRRQDAPSVKKAIDDAIQQLEGSKTRVREAYDLTYEYKQARPASGAAPGAAAGLEAERANARAAIAAGAPEAAVRARFKEKTGQEL